MEIRRRSGGDRGPEEEEGDGRRSGGVRASPRRGAQTRKGRRKKKNLTYGPML